MTKRDVIDDIRKEYADLKDKPRKSLVNSLRKLADELYAKDTHFILELIQNAEDNTYKDGIIPSLSFKISEIEIEGKRHVSLIISNNETGFEKEHVEAICQSGETTKKKEQGYIGEKGIGFKSVFKITSCPYIFSNGFRFSLPENDEETGLGYIVPKWVDHIPGFVNSNETTIILPIDKHKDDIRKVVDALREIAPETILFLDKLKSIEIFVSLPTQCYEVIINKNDIQIPLVELKRQVKDNDLETHVTSQYWMESGNFSPQDNIVPEERKGITTRKVSVAIPLEPGGQIDKLFAYLPVWEDTGLRFLINADFLLVSSREGIREDKEWNIWLRYCVSEVYKQAFLACIQDRSLPVEKRSFAYASIPIPNECKKTFLEPAIERILQYLKVTECIPTIPKSDLCIPKDTRLSFKLWRDILATHSKIQYHLVMRELETYSKQIQAIGVTQITPDEILAYLKDSQWLQEHSLEWFLELYNKLSAVEFELCDFGELPIVPTSCSKTESFVLSYNSIKHPIYFPNNDKVISEFGNNSDWFLSTFPAVFVVHDFIRLIEQQDASRRLINWMKNALKIHDFTFKEYCECIQNKLLSDWAEFQNNELILAAIFCTEFAGENFNWELFPVVLSDGRKKPLREVRNLKFIDGNNTSNLKKIQAIVVPENYDTDSGWQHIWQTEDDRKHFVALANDYSSMPQEWFDKCNIQKYPGFQFIEYEWNSDIPIESDRKMFNACFSKAANRWRYDASLTSIKVPSALCNYSKGELVDAKLYRSLLQFIKSANIPDVKWIPDKRFHELGLKSCANYENRGKWSEFCDSPVLELLKKVPWLPSTKGQVRPFETFLPIESFKEIFGDTVPYFEGDLPTPVLKLLGIHTDWTVKEMIKALKDYSEDENTNLGIVKRIYSELESRTRHDGHDVKSIFAENTLICVKTQEKPGVWRKSTDCVWEDASDVLGDDFIYLQRHYPKLKEFFVERLEVKEQVDTECFARRWLKLQDAPLNDRNEQRKLVERIYREIRPVALMQGNDRPVWWGDFTKKLKIYTQSDSFKPPPEVVVPDDGELKGIFKQSDLHFTWRPTKDAFSDWLQFYQSLKIHLLSESVTEELEDDGVDYREANNRYMTEATVKMIAAWIRERGKGHDDYDRLLNDGAFKELFDMKEGITERDIRIVFRFKTEAVKTSQEKEYPVFWKRDDNVLIYRNDAGKSLIASTVAKGLFENRAYKDLADWIELVLGAENTTRLSDRGWNVPQEILELLRIENTSRIPDEDSIHEIEAPVEQNDHSIQEKGSQASPDAISGNNNKGETKDDTNRGTLKNDISRIPRSISKAGSDKIDKVVTEDARNQQKAENKTEAIETSLYTEKQTSYVEQIKNAFNRMGKTQLDEDIEDHDYYSDGNIVNNPERRGRKLQEHYRESINTEPRKDERRRVTERIILEGPNPRVRTSLHEWYHGKCQICEKTWPEHTGEPFFAAAYLVERQNARWLDDAANAICLCAEHFAQWRHAVKKESQDIVEQIKKLSLLAEGGDGNLSILFTMLGQETRIKYCEKHFLALKKLIEVSDAENSNGMC